MIKWVTKYSKIVLLGICFHSFVVGQSNNQQFKKTDWKKVQLKVFSFKCPKSLKLSKEKGVDSSVWIYFDKHRKLYIEIGQYVGSKNEFKGEKNFQEENININDVKGVISNFEFHEKPDELFQFGTTLILLKKDGAKFNLSIALFSNIRIDKAVAKKIFESIKFR